MGILTHRTNPDPNAPQTGWTRYYDHRFKKVGYAQDVILWRRIQVDAVYHDMWRLHSKLLFDDKIVKDLPDVDWWDGVEPKELDHRGQPLVNFPLKTIPIRQTNLPPAPSIAPKVVPTFDGEVIVPRERLGAIASQIEYNRQKKGTSASEDDPIDDTSPLAREIQERIRVGKLKRQATTHGRSSESSDDGTTTRF